MIRGLWKLPGGRDWLRGKLDVVLLVGAMLGKLLIQISVDGWSCVPSLLFTWGQPMVELMKIMVTSIKRSPACTATLSAPNPAAGHHQPTPPPETPGHSLASLGQSVLGSLLLSSGSCCIRFCCALQESTSQSCVSSGSSVVGLMVTSSKRSYVIPRSTAPRGPALAAVHCWPIHLQETLKHSSGSVSVNLWVLVCTRFVWALQVSLAAMGFDSKCDFSPPTMMVGLLLCPWTWSIFFWLDSSVDGYSAMSYNFGALPGEDGDRAKAKTTPSFGCDLWWK